jgi:hypothetical protein
MRRNRYILAAAVVLAIASTVSAPAAVTANVRTTGGQPPPIWNHKILSVSGAVTTMAPALTVLKRPGNKSETALFWTGPLVGGVGHPICYAIAENLQKDKWSPPRIVGAQAPCPHASPDRAAFNGVPLTDQRPSAAQFGPVSDREVIVVWKAAQAQQVGFSIGTIQANGGLSWSPGSFLIPGAFTSNGPTVFSPLQSDTVFVAWDADRSLQHSIDFVVGHRRAGSTRSAGSTSPITWGPIQKIPGVSATTADSTGAAEVKTGHGSGRLYVIWRKFGDARIDGAWTPEPLSPHPPWTDFESTISTGAAPAATAAGPGRSYPLLVIYRVLHDTTLLYAFLNASDSFTKVPRGTAGKLITLLGPALIWHLAAATPPGGGEVHYLPYVRTCAGC